MKSSRLPLLMSLILILAAVGISPAHAAFKPKPTTNATAGKDPYMQPLRHQKSADAFTKLGRGLTNIIEGPFELYAQTVLASPKTETVYAFFTGVTRGLAMFVVREFVGIYDIVTFPIPVPKNYQPLIQPATTFTDFSQRLAIAQS